MRIRWLFLLAACLVCVPASAQDAVDYTGTWDLAAEVPLVEENGEGGSDVLPVCMFEGTAIIQQDGSSLTGEAMLMLVGVDPPGGCPAEMKAMLSNASVKDSTISGSLDGGMDFGTADFTGSLSRHSRAPLSLSGSMNVTSGPYLGVAGQASWSGMQRQPMPATPGTFLAVLLVALLAGGSWLLMRRRAA